jgi:hypothetical protein
MPLMQSPRPNAAHMARRSSTGTGGALSNMDIGGQFAARSPPSNAAGKHQDRPIMPSNLHHCLNGSLSPLLNTKPAALKSP